MKNVQYPAETTKMVGYRIPAFSFAAALLFFSWLIPGKTLASSETDTRSGCTGFNSTHTNATLDTCKKIYCFTAHMEGQFMHGNQDWHVDWGDGNTFDTSTTSPPQGVNGWDSITFTVCHTYAAAGNYNITLSVTPAHSTCMDQFQITIPPGSVLNVNSPTICNGSSATLTASGGTTYNWSTGAVTPSIVVSPAQTTTYTVTSPGCSTPTQAVVTVNPIPVANFNPTTVCLGNPTCFTDQSSISSGTISTWAWNFGDPASGAANTSAAQSPCHTYVAAGTYNTTLTVTSAAGCVNVITLPVIVYPLPTAAFTPNAPCLGTTTNLTDNSLPAAGDPIVGYNWAMPGGTPASSASQNTSTIYGAAGTHTVTLIVTSQKGCKDTLAQQVLVYNPPVANFSKPDSGCAPICVNYNDLSTSADGTINSWQWSFPGGSPGSTTSAAPQNICYNSPGSYSVSLIVTTNFGCKDTIQLPMINVFPWPKAEFCVAPSVAPVTTPVFSFCDLWSADVVSWSWNFGDNDSDLVNTDPIHSYSLTANNNDFYAYNICVRVKNVHGCWDTVCHVVELIPEFEFYIPNCFTPNQDFMNETFYGKCRGVKEYNIWVFDRWGNQLWDCHREDKNTNWDSDASIPHQEGLASACQWNGVVVEGGMDMSGSSKQLAQEDVYVWKVRLTDIFNKKHTYIGHVSIVK